MNSGCCIQMTLSCNHIRIITYSKRNAQSSPIFSQIHGLAGYYANCRFIMVVYHLLGKTGWSTVVVNGTRQIPNGNFSSQG